MTDATNAARTMLYNIYEHRWDEVLLRAMDIPAQVLPKVVDTSGVVGMLDKRVLGREIPVAALVGDQQAALFGHGCFAPGMSKNTYGTGCFLLMNTGLHPVKSVSDLITTIAWQLDGQARYALEGSVFVGRGGGQVAARRDGPDRLGRGDPRRWLPPSPTTATSTSCPPSPGWARRTGTCTAAAPSSALRAARAGRTSSARRWRPSPTSPRTCSRP